ncbi:MAG: acyltransferase [Lachnospiraceae bacterium]|nr:acyltransferase [Lachnospiraceae bacterium]
MIRRLFELIEKYLRYILYNDPIQNAKTLRKRGIVVGENCAIYNSYIDYYPGYITIGDNVTITNATILAHDASTDKFIGKTKVLPVKIGNRVFVGYGSIITAGTRIGNDVIIGAGAVVRGEIPDNCVVVGNPCRVVCTTSEYAEKNKMRMNSSDIEFI